MSAAVHSGGCLCGAVRYRFAGDPLMVAVCHCRHCQRQSGSAFSIVCAVPGDAFEQQGATRMFENVGESGGIVERRFCGACGSPIVSVAAAIPGLTIVKAGTLDRPEAFRPTIEVFCDAGLPWLPAIADERHPRSNI